MTLLDRGVWIWSGFPGGPGYSTFYAIPQSGMAAKINTFFQSLAANIPADVKITTPGSGETIEDSTGEVVGQWTQTPPAPIQCTGAGAYSAPTGACVTWKTGLFLNSRRLVGRTFLVPLTGNSFEADGTLSSAALTTIQNAAVTLYQAAAGNFAVWHRPNPVGTATGQHGAVTAQNTSDRAAVLRTRRP